MLSLSSCSAFLRISIAFGVLLSVQSVKQVVSDIFVSKSSINKSYFHCSSSCYFFYDSVTVHCNRFLVNKTNRRTEFQFYWYYDFTCFGQPFCPSSGVLSRTSALVHFMQL